MRWILLIVVAVRFIGGTGIFMSRYVFAWRGRRNWRRWQCPDCHQPFGAEATLREWRRRRDVGIKSELSARAVVRCSRCAGDYWFIWRGHLIGLDSTHRSFEIVERARWSDL